MIETTLPAEVLVCVKCRRAGEEEETDRRPGAHLYDNLIEAGLPDGLSVKAVECLSNCSQGCSVAFRGAGRWTYVYGNFDENRHVETLKDGAARYQATSDGLVPWRERPEHFRKNCIARIPPLEA